MSDMPRAPYNQPYGTPQGVERYDLCVKCDCGYVATIPVEVDRSVNAAEWLEVPWCDECDEEIPDKTVWRA